MEHKTEAVRRLTWLAFAVGLWGLFILARLVSLQVVRHEDFVSAARHQQERRIDIAAPRGSLYDRSGEPLAMSVPLESVFVNPLQVPDIGVAADLFSRILEIDRPPLYARLRWALEKRKGFLWVKRKIHPSQGARLRGLKLDWIEFQTESQRYYPKGKVGAHLIGSVDHQERGNAGLELKLDAELRGIAGKARLLTDVRRIPIALHAATDPRAGVNLILTVDERIQFAAERDLAAAVREHRAASGSVVVMDPYSGDIYAMASFPDFDPGKAPAPGEPLGTRLNQAVSAPFEPGSVFKVITIAAALETTNLTPESIIHCGDGTFAFFGRVIHEAKRGHGDLTVAQVLERSSNIGAIQIALRVGQPKLYEYVRRFGFGSRTGVPLPAEERGMLRPLERWQKTSIASVAMGHEISTTTVQLARALSVIANGGELVTPRLVLRRQRGDGPWEEAPPGPRARALKPETTVAMRRMMEGVVIDERGTGRRARLDGYSGGGKTGSAQIFDFATHHYTHTYNASYMGFAPVGNPRIVVAVTLNGTSGGSQGYGGVVAAPVFKSVAQEALRVLDVPKDLPDAPAPEDDRKGAKTEEVADLAIAELATEPAPEAHVPPPSGPTIPDFQGKTMRAVVEEAASLGLAVLLDGSGVARAQYPPPGAPLEKGERIRVQFAR